MPAAVVISGVVVFAVFALAVASGFLVWVVLDRRRRGIERQAQFLEGLRRITSRVVSQRGPSEAPRRW
jgi:Flp pilus assembly protein TadB